VLVLRHWCASLVGLMEALTPAREDLKTLTKSSSAGALTKSSSAGALRGPCLWPGSRSFKSSVSQSRLPVCAKKRTPEEEWLLLSQGLKDAFALSNRVSPEHPAAACLEGRDVKALVSILEAYGTWKQEEYTRRPVLLGEGFTAMLLCWSPSACSPVHAHSDKNTGVQSNCFMLILEGELTETVFDVNEIADDTVSGGQSRTLVAGSTGYINDSYGVHKVANLTDRPAMSLHVYAPGWSAVALYDENTDAGGAPIDDLDAWGDF